MKVQNVEFCLRLALVCSQLCVFFPFRDAYYVDLKLSPHEVWLLYWNLSTVICNFMNRWVSSVKSEILAFTFIGGVLKLTLDFQKNWAGFTSDHPCITSTVYIHNTCVVSSENRRKSERWISGNPAWALTPPPPTHPICMHCHRRRWANNLMEILRSKIIWGDSPLAIS